MDLTGKDHDDGFDDDDVVNAWLFLQYDVSTDKIMFVGTCI